MSDTYTGSCLCGAVRYRVDGPIRNIVNCHCGQCRKTTGHFMAAANAWRDDFHLLEDRGLAWYRASDFAGRGFCRECGSTLFWRSDTGDNIAIAAGTLDDSRDLKVQGNIFVADKGGYYEVEPDLPQFEQSDAGDFPMPERARPD
ncbi:MAG: GFA family protein [Minwuia sp.]|uniref:GFA family protein n=1 Tax=Minwuia sp. TaxID=2493630 RepID=UPI003A8579AD